MGVLQTTKITLAWQLFESGIPKRHIARRLELHHETVGIWIREIQSLGLLGFLDKYTQARRVERPARQVDPILKR